MPVELLRGFAYLAVAAMSVVSFILFGVDKRRAIRGLWRVPERTLLLCALFGAPGALLGMGVFHHKTRKPLFRVLVPALLVLDAVLLVAVRA